MIDFVTSRRDPTPEELPEHIRQAMAKTPTTWTVGLEAESSWNLESSFLLAQALGFQTSIMLERCLDGWTTEVEQHLEIRREREKALAVAEEAEAKAEKVRAASKELEAEVARLRDEAAR